MKKKIYSILLLVILIFSFMFTGISASATEAEGKTYSNVLDDLKKDPSFKESDYPANTSDYSIKVIQIAESTDDELFIYVYQPAHTSVDFDITQIAMWNEYSQNGKDFTPKLYDLELVSNHGVFEKYLVKGFTVGSDAYRYYNISAIYRKFHSKVDTSIDNGTTTEKAISVGQQWCLYSYNDKLVYEMNTFDVVEITPIYNDEIALKNGLTFGSFGGFFDDSELHYITFNVENYDVTKIFDADLSYNSRHYSLRSGYGMDDVYGDWEGETTVFLSEFGKGEFIGEGLFARELKWDEISSASYFKEYMLSQDVDLTDETLKKLDESEWVFVFAETEKSYTVASGYTLIDGTEIADVTILRLHFQTPQGVYNLGAVMDKTTSDGIPGGVLKADDYSKLTEGLGKGFKIVLLILGLILVLVVCSYISPILSLVIKGIVEGVTLIVELLFSVISSLFSLIGGIGRDKKP